ncbi:hypothetical protein H4582DRAFT_2057159 [Lactarius indigo]|nr:hypothetical protein H4582DRAFT_2057159 [Lactarius indigo]
MNENAVPQCMVSQAILGLRAFTISRKNRNVGIVLSLAFVFSATLEWLSSVWRRIPVFTDGSCGAATLHPTLFLSTWLFYLVGMLYDLLTLSISMGYLFKYHSSSPFTSRLVKMMVYDGLGYFVALTVVNTINAILFRTHNTFIQLVLTRYFAPCGGVVTWIMSQRILINLQGAGAERLSTETPPYVHRSTRTLSAKDRSSSGVHHVHHVEQDGTELVQVRVDRSVVVGMEPGDWKAAPCDSDKPFRTPAVKWDEASV